jgi:hypothetical protein
MRGDRRLRFRERAISLQRAPNAVGTTWNFRRALVLWLVMTLPWPSGGSACPLPAPEPARSRDACCCDRQIPSATLGLEPVRSGPGSARHDSDVDDRAILDDDAADEEAPLGDGAYFCDLLLPAGSSPTLSPHPVMSVAGSIGGHAKGLPDLCRYRC